MSYKTPYLLLGSGGQSGGAIGRGVVPNVNIRSLGWSLKPQASPSLMELSVGMEVGDGWEKVPHLLSIFCMPKLS